jgi:hypothetical protein
MHVNRSPAPSLSGASLCHSSAASVRVCRRVSFDLACTFKSSHAKKSATIGPAKHQSTWTIDGLSHQAPKEVSYAAPTVRNHRYRLTPFCPQDSASAARLRRCRERSGGIPSWSPSSGPWEQRAAIRGTTPFAAFTVGPGRAPGVSAAVHSLTRRRTRTRNGSSLGRWCPRGTRGPRGGCSRRGGTGPRLSRRTSLPAVS